MLSGQGSNPWEIVTGVRKGEGVTWIARDTYVLFTRLDTCSNLKLLGQMFIFSPIDFLLLEDEEWLLDVELLDADLPCGHDDTLIAVEAFW